LGCERNSSLACHSALDAEDMEYIPANKSLPPKALGVAGCVLGLTASNAIESDSPLQALAPFDAETNCPGKPFSLEIVARAACSLEKDLRKWTVEVDVLIARAVVDMPAQIAQAREELSGLPSKTKPAAVASPSACESFASSSQDTQRPFSSGDSCDDDGIVTLLVRAFSRTVLPHVLLEAFRDCAQAESAQIILDRSGASRCYGFVRFEDAKQARVAFEACQNEIITIEDKFGEQRKLKANFAKKNIPTWMPPDPSSLFSCRSECYQASQVPSGNQSNIARLNNGSEKRSDDSAPHWKTR